MFIIQGRNMEIFNITALLIISIMQLGYIFIQHFSHRSQIKKFIADITAMELQINDKTCVIKELQTQVEKQN